MISKEVKERARGNTLFWFRRDLRLNDNAGLFHALKSGDPVIPIFIFDRHILDELDEDDARVEFIHRSLESLKKELEDLGSTLLVVHSTPEECFSTLEPKAVYTNHDFEPYGIERDERVNQLLQDRGVEFHTFKDHVIFERNEVVKDDGKPYTVFTPFSKKWKARLQKEDYQPHPVTDHVDRFLQTSPAQNLKLQDIGFRPSGAQFPARVIAKDIIRKYEEQRDYPSVKGTTRLSVHLRFGTVSVRQLVGIALKESEKWLNELIWREFYMMILWHFPHVVGNSFRSEYDRILWRNDPEEFEAWTDGRTGFPIVDAGMRELNQTGFMHNRVRMIVASFLCKDLQIDWRWGEAYFAKKLLDFELSSNNGGWQWAAGSGCDAAPYFRVFNPELQMKKFDPELKYVREWVPEYGTPDYPDPIVVHSEARDRTLEMYNQALKR